MKHNTLLTVAALLSLLFLGGLGGFTLILWDLRRRASLPLDEA